MKYLINYKASIIYILFIVLLNSIFVYAPNLTWHGYELSTGDIIVGFVYVLRDFAQKEIAKKVIFAMLIGCFLSFFLADEQTAIASLIAFAVGETIDWAIYTFSNKPLSQRIFISSIISTPADSIINLYLLNQLNILALSLMLIAKFIGVILLWGIWRMRNNHNKDLLLATTI